MIEVLVRSNHVLGSPTNEEISKLLYTQSLAEVEESVWEEMGYTFPQYILRYTDPETAHRGICSIFDLINFPDQSSDIKKDSLSIMAQGGSLLDLIIDKRFEQVGNDITTLDMVCSDLEEDICSLKEQIDSIAAFLVKTGLVHYQQTISHLLNQLESGGKIDSSLIQSKIFPTIH